MKYHKKRFRFFLIFAMKINMGMARRDTKYLIIVAGGSGTRMGGATPKQFMDLCGEPVLRRTIDRFLSYSEDFRTIIVLPSDKKKIWIDYCDRARYAIGPHVIVPGGITRFHSVRNALKYVEPGMTAAVHDGVRPFPSRDMLDRLFALASACPAVCPAIASSDTLRRLRVGEDGLLLEADIDRSRVYRIQTPQVFHTEVLLEAYSQPYSERYTDDASVVEAYGCPVKYVQGSKFNLKLTTPDDLALAERLFEAGI